MKWENVYVFISSTFNDMHAERDYLVKRVFPQLRIWCAQRKLKLMDIDLRWGISEADAQENKRVVEVCLKNIDKCRPFFLCFLGQRRGWVPGAADVNPLTLEEFPELKGYLGEASVTELEVIHALLHPLADGRPPVRHARFYFRDGAYVKKISEKEIRKLYAPTQGVFSRTDKPLDAFKQKLRKRFPVYEYSGTWNAQAVSPELRSVQGRDLSRGRLENFRAEGESLKEHVLSWLQAAIAGEFPEHMTDRETLDDLELELERQDTVLFQACEAYIARSREEEALLSYAADEDRRPLWLLAEAGAGKSSLLASMISKRRFHACVYYRQLGVTADSSTSDRLLASLLREMAADGLLAKEEVERPADLLRMLFPQLLLAAAGEQHKLLIVLDGLDQLRGKDEDLSWIPAVLPERVKLIVSRKVALQETACRDRERRCHVMGRLERTEDQERLIRGYLGQFLKDIDDRQLAAVISMKGSGNPLYLKIVLNELRQYGSFESLMEKLASDYGSDPRQAFGVVLSRVQEEMRFLYPWGDTLTEVFFGTLSCSLEGITAKEYACLLGETVPKTRGRVSIEAAADAVYGLARELEPYFCVDGDRIAFLYESFRLAALDRFGAQRETFHSFLRELYRKRVKEGRQKRDYIQLLYHLVRMEKDLARKEMTDAALWLEVLCHAGAGVLADAFEDGAVLGYEGFEETARLLSKIGVRLTANPQSLFMELRRYAGKEDAVAAAVLAQERAYTNLMYFKPLDPPGLAAVLQKEYTLADDQEELYAADSCYVLRRRQEIRILDCDTMKVEGFMALSYDADETVECTVRGDRLFVHYLARRTSRTYRIETYTLPELTRIGLSPEYPLHTEFGSCWGKQGAGGCLYGFYEWEEPDQSQVVRLVDLTADKVVFQNHLTAFTNSQIGGFSYKITGQQHCFAGDYLVLGDKGSNEVIVFSLLLRKVVWEKETISGNLYAAAEGDMLCIWISANEGTQIVCLRPENGMLRAVQERMLSCPLCDQLSLAGGKLFALANSSFLVLDEELQTLGYADLKLPRQSKSWGGRAKRRGDELILYSDQRIQSYPYQAFLEALENECPASSANIQYDSLVYEGGYYMLTNPLRRYDLESGREEEEVRDAYDKIYLYDSCNLYLGHILTGLNHWSGVYCMKDLQTMKLVLRVQLDPAENRWLEAVFLTNEGRVGMVLTEKEMFRREVLRRALKGEETASELYSHVEVRVYRLRGGCLAEDSVWKLEDEVAVLDRGNALRSMPMRSVVATQTDLCLVLPRVYVNAREAELRIYRLSDRACVYRYSYQGTALDEKHILRREGRVLFWLNESRERQTPPAYVLVEICLEPLQVFRTPLCGPLIGDISDTDEVVAFLRREGRIQVYSLQEHRIVREFCLAEQDRARDVVQANLLGETLVLRIGELGSSSSSEVVVYDVASGQRLFAQLFETNIGVLCTDSKTGSLCSLGMDLRRGCWRLVGRN